VAQTGAYTVTIDADITCTAIEATSSGHFEVTAGGRTINANFVMASSYATNGGLRCTHTTGTVTLNGTISGTAGTVAVGNNGAGTLTVVGATVTAPAGTSSSRGINNASTGTVNVTADVYASANSSSNGVRATGNGNINITGNVFGGVANIAVGVFQSGTGTIAISGNATAGAGTASHGSHNEDSAGVITIGGTATGGSETDTYGALNQSTGTIAVDQAIGGTNKDAPGLYGTVTGGTTTYKRIGSAANGNSAVGGFCKLVVDADYNVIVVKDSAGDDVSLSNDYPAAAKVISDTTYNRTTVVGTYHAPSVGEVIDTAVFGAASGTSGTFKVPPASKVEDDYQYGASGTQYTGELAAGGGMLKGEKRGGKQ